MATEQHLESFLDSHPYLLARELGRSRPSRQLRKGKYRLDLLFQLKRGYCVVELKKTPLSHSDVQQIETYCRLLLKEGLPLSHHYLVGFRPTNLDLVQKEIARLNRSSIEVRLRYLGEHVPLSVLWDGKQRKYVTFQPELCHLGECFQLRL
jgi:hypothetical protein